VFVPESRSYVEDIVNVEIGGTFGNDKRKEQEARQIIAVQWTTLLLRIWNVCSSVLGLE
jgi:hypothetical protein